MAIIGKVGRKTFKVKALNLIIHLILLIGAVTMVYPFMVMISASFKSNVDNQTFSVYPRFFLKEKVLYQKYIESRMNELGDRLIEQYGNKFLSFTLLEPPQKIEKQWNEDWQQFLKEKKDEHDIFDYYISEQFGWGIYPRNERKFRSYIKSKTGNELQNMNEMYGTSTLNWEEVRVEERETTGRNFTGAYSGFLSEYDEFRSGLELWHREYISFDGDFIATQLIPEFRNDLQALNKSLATSYNNWDEIKLSSRMPEGTLQPFWIDYVKKHCNIHHIKFTNAALPSWQEYLKEKYEDIALLNRTWQTNYQSFSEMQLPFNIPRSGAMPVDYTFFLENIAEPDWIVIETVEFEWRRWLHKKYRNIRQINEVYKRGFKSFNEIGLPEEIPTDNLAKAKIWEEFIRDYAELKDLSLLPQSQKEYLEYLSEKFPGKDGEIDLVSLNEIFGTDYKQSINIYPADKIPENRESAKYWDEFVHSRVDSRFLKIEKSAQTKWQNYLHNKYRDVMNLNYDWKLLWQDFSDIPIDQYQIDYQIFKEHERSIFWEFATRNYIMVLDEMLYNGRAIINTIIYCLLAIVTALIVNPLAAYAMSRYKLPATYKIILVLMLTMAFPPMVMGIPNFLVMKKLGMLNTFWALILPGLADGYFIFLLKGFFDSLPKELFESATIDGASEWTIFWRIAMSLSKPIMAVIALNAFNAAYRNFMFAFIVCQDKSMWTMMVNIYQLMQRASAGVGFAALVIASIPTFAVFVFFQNIIIRGIVVPTEK